MTVPDSVLNRMLKKLLPNFIFQRFSTSSIARRLAYGSAWGLLGSVLSRILVLLSMIFLARIVGKETFGQFSLVQSTISVAGLMAGASIGATATRYVAQYASTDPARAGGVIGFVLLVSRVTVVFVAFLLLFGSEFLAVGWLNSPGLVYALMLSSVVMAVITFRGVQVGILSGLEHFDLVAKLNIVEGVGTLFGLIFLGSLFGLEGAVLGLAFGNGVAWLLGARFLRIALAARGILINYSGLRSHLRILHMHTLPNLLAGLVATPVLWFCMSLLARSTGGFEQVALYNAAYQWHGPIIFIPLIMMSVALPIFVQEWEAKRIRRFRKLTFIMCFMVLGISAPLVAALLVFSESLMGLYGDGFEAGVSSFYLLVLAAPLHGVSKILASSLLAMEKAWLVLIANTTWGIALIIFAFWLIPLEGAYGLAMAFLGAYLVMLITKIIMIWC